MRSWFGSRRLDAWYWPYPEAIDVVADFRLCGYSGKDLLTLSSSLRDPNGTSLGLAQAWLSWTKGH
jgi:hypothetical protein